ncbi:PaaI family thioesterase [Pseudogemmobacter faecipullorum]|uniref:PaaI family thioesterase n=1 Tax=Pseudogemmobacter faecipullorum TaxID=2755041 RepID=A0ABS8CIJ4_9RHOB|nr:PaaI family thioesterase [Pseudogemmobacter faecipullorum]MCB5409003.1 PaaI family thioesterase [Pseudogemmobacter faecipullorum]
MSEILSPAALLQEMAASVPYLAFLGIRFETAGDELTGVLPYRPELIGNPMLPALHGGVTAAFLEVTAITGLLWSGLRQGRIPARSPLILPKTIDLTIDYLRPGQPRDAFARARINRSGRRYASVHVETWQDDPARLFAQATGHFLTRSE